ncbi:DUF4278 domain-containing protein [Chroococcus sp. FPU101]|uniref:DUF4278 domain-containing protein n=1 Tax=Chroococcus sp. FPU101 TaxID=1974212 RepID=UPI001A8FEADA|nr:DUF4278 domain-containing protein [Chroococcus sp. FPU101]GFE67930.1 hypothetical protein CFPU101_05400 [Chroococcus sp. FPU101]
MFLSYRGQFYHAQSYPAFSINKILKFRGVPYQISSLATQSLTPKNLKYRGIAYTI